VRIVVSGAGAAGIAITKLLHMAGARHLLLTDSKGIISSDREDLNDVKRSMLDSTNQENVSGSLADALHGADVFIGVSAPGILTQEMIASMHDPIIFAMANPVPEILPQEALEAGAKVVATGRSDFANQVNNALVFPGLFRGLLDAEVKTVTEDIMLNAARALADLVSEPSHERIIPSIFDDGVSESIANAVRNSVA
jgi:malate dehydrogenase (oxaloacetate-decarboxylating)